MESKKAMIIRELNRREVPNDVKRKIFSLKSVATEVLHEVLIMKTFDGRRKANALRLLYQMQLGSDPDGLLDLALRHAVDQQTLVREAACRILITIMLINKETLLKHSFKKATREIVCPVLQQSLLMGAASKDLANAIEQFLG
jgi:hypothetical protein